MHKTILIAAMAAIMLQGCMGKKNGEEPIRINGLAQGTYYSVIYYDEKGRNLQGEIDSILKDFDQTASLWVDSSMIRRVNENKDSVVNELFATLTELSTEMNSYTSGAFDCTVGGLVKAWGFSFSDSVTISDEMVDSLLRYTGKQPVIVDNGGRKIVRKGSPEVTFDFNAIAQGYSTDMICRFLETKGIENYIVDIGGEVRAKGAKADGSLWKVGVEKPSKSSESGREVQASIYLQDKSIVTSGNYRKYREKDGIRYSHTIDPTTGRPVEHTLLSVSVVDTAAWRADALATAFMVMGLEKSLKFIEEHSEDPGKMAVYFIYNEEGENKTYSTPGFEKLMAE